MARLENFVPVIHQGRIIESQPNHLIFEFDEGGKKQVPLGEHLLPLVKSLNGTNSLSELLVNQFKTQDKPLLVGELLNALSLMGTHRLFQNNDELMDSLASFVDGHNYNSLKNKVTTDKVSADYFTKQRLMMILRNTALNAKNDDKILDRIVSCSRLMSVPEGEIIIQEGDIGEDVYVLLTGELGIYTRNETENPWDFIASISAVCIFGESAAMPERKRNATVMPVTNSWVLEVPFQKLVNVNREETFTDFSSLRTRMVMNQILQTAPMFQGLPSDALHEFVRRCELIQVNQGFDIIFQRELTTDESSDVYLDASAFYFILDGSVEVIKNGESVGVLNSGDYFGEVGALNKMGRTATCRAKTTCKLLTLSAESLNYVFSKNFKLALQVEKKAEDRIMKNMDLEEEEFLSPVHFDIEKTSVTAMDIKEAAEYKGDS